MPTTAATFGSDGNFVKFWHKLSNKILIRTLCPCAVDAWKLSKRGRRAQSSMARCDRRWREEAGHRHCEIEMYASFRLSLNFHLYALRFWLSRRERTSEHFCMHAAYALQTIRACLNNSLKYYLFGRLHRVHMPLHRHEWLHSQCVRSGKNICFRFTQTDARREKSEREWKPFPRFAASDTMPWKPAVVCCHCHANECPLCPVHLHLFTHRFRLHRHLVSLRRSKCDQIHPGDCVTALERIKCEIRDTTSARIPRTACVYISSVLFLYLSIDGPFLYRFYLQFVSLKMNKKKVFRMWDTVNGEQSTAPTLPASGNVCVVWRGCRSPVLVVSLVLFERIDAKPFLFFR